MSKESETQKEKIGSGKNITRVNERIFKRGTLMFIEGEASAEMFIVRTGKIRILKQEGAKTVELAVLGAGSVLGELSLLDHQPRSATAQVIEDVRTTVIDENLFNHTMKTIPTWLANIIHLVVKRLRDTLKRTSESIVEKSVAGVCRLLLLIAKTEQAGHQKQTKIPLSIAKDIIASTIGIGEVEIENVLLHLILKEMLFIRKDDVGKEHIIIIDTSILQLYLNYLRCLQSHTKMPGADLSPEALELIKVLIDAGEKSGKSIQQGILKISLPQVEIELQRQGKGKNLNYDILDYLLKQKIIFAEQNLVKTSYQRHQQTAIIYNEGALNKIITLHLWLPIFQEEIVF